SEPSKRSGWRRERGSKKPRRGAPYYGMPKSPETRAPKPIKVRSYRSRRARSDRRHLRPFQRRGGQRNGEAAAFIQLAIDFDRAPVRFNDPVHEAQPQPEAAFAVRVRAGNLVEA